MKQREYPCFVLSVKTEQLHIAIHRYSLKFYKTEALFFEVENFENQTVCDSEFVYKTMATHGLKHSHALKVPFYNEVKS